MKPLTDYAVYKENNQPWTVEEVKLIAKAMMDKSSFSYLNDTITKYVYSDHGWVYNWFTQDVENKTPITYTDFLKLTQHKPTQDKPMKNRQGKYLSLKVKDGEANVRNLIYQAYATGINDPRPYIQELISNEKKRLKQVLNSLDLASINYGFNIKLASLIAHGKQLQNEFYNNPDFELSLTRCINIYNLTDELHTFLEMQNTEDPYKWIADYLTPKLLDVPTPKVLFKSNKLTIKLQDGCLYYTDHKSNIEYKAEIKLDLKSNTYYI